jgi:molecular chaperone DnaK (HSP70)
MAKAVGIDLGTTNSVVAVIASRRELSGAHGVGERAWSRSV